jgi:hypothetical protein
MCFDVACGQKSQTSYISDVRIRGNHRHHKSVMSAAGEIIEITLRIPRSLVFTIQKLLISEADVAPMRAHDGDGVLQWSNRLLN